jgi:hypothetical protein
MPHRKGKRTNGGNKSRRNEPVPAPKQELRSSKSVVF